MALRDNTPRPDYLYRLLDLYYPLHFFAIFRAHELYNVEPYIGLLRQPILDLGCGDGEVSNLLFGGSLDYAIDPDEGAVRRARGNGRYKTVFAGDAHTIPLENNSLGGIFSNCVLEHIPDLPALFSEVSRVLKPGAYFVATCLSPGYYEMNPLFKMFDTPMLRPIRSRMIEAENRLQNHVSVFGVDDYARVLNQNGMKLETFRFYATGSVMRFCCKWNSMSKYIFPYPFLLSHVGLPIVYLQIRYRLFSRKDATIDKWHREFFDMCYSRNKSDDFGAGLILVGKKKELK